MQKEHLTNDEKLANIVGIFTNNRIIGSEAGFDKIAANTFDLTDLINTNNTNNNYINNINTNYLDVNNINGKTGTINTITSKEIQGTPDNLNGTFDNIYLQNLTNIDLSGNNVNFNRINANNINMNNNFATNLNGNFNNINVNNYKSNNIIGNTNISKNIISSEINSNYIYGNTGNFNAITSITTPIISNIIIDKSINTEMCFSPNKCISKDTNILLNRMTNPVNNYMYLPNSPGKIDNNIIWDNIRNEINPDNTSNGALKAINDTWDLTNNVTKWNNKYVYRTKNGDLYQNDGSGIEITIPPPTSDMTEDFTVLWVQTLTNYDINMLPRFNAFRVYDYTNPSKINFFGKHVTGANYLSNINPDGSTSSLEFNKFSWWPVPIDMSGNTSRKLMISSFLNAINDTSSDLATVYSGFAFSTNPWNHCPVNAVSLHWNINTVDANDNVIIGKSSNSSILYKDDDWNGRHIAYFLESKTAGFRIPFVNSQKDKIFYIIEHNTDWSPSVSYLEIRNESGTWIKLGNFYTTFNNPFSKHINSKKNQRYYGIVIPKQYLPIKGTKNDNFLRLNITIPSGNNFIFSEVGTHDLSPF